MIGGSSWGRMVRKHVAFSSFTKQMVWNLTQDYRKPRGCKPVWSRPLVWSDLVLPVLPKALCGLTSRPGGPALYTPDIRIGTYVVMWGQRA